MSDKSRPSRATIVLSVLLGVSLLANVVLLTSRTSPAPPAPAVVTSTSGGASDGGAAKVAPRTAEAFSFKAFAKDYKAHETRASKRYKGKWFMFEGKVRDVSWRRAITIIVTEEGEHVSSLHCGLREGVTSESFDKQQHVKLICKIESIYGSSDVTVGECAKL